MVAVLVKIKGVFQEANSFWITGNVNMNIDMAPQKETLQRKPVEEKKVKEKICLLCT